MRKEKGKKLTIIQNSWTFRRVRRRRWRCSSSSRRRWSPCWCRRLLIIICGWIADNVNLFVVFDLNRFAPIRPGISFEFFGHQAFGHGVVEDGGGGLRMARSCLESLFRRSLTRPLSLTLQVPHKKLAKVSLSLRRGWGHTHRRKGGTKQSKNTQQWGKVSHQVGISLLISAAFASFTLLLIFFFSSLHHIQSIKSLVSHSLDEAGSEGKKKVLLVAYNSLYTSRSLELMKVQRKSFFFACLMRGKMSKVFG